MLHHLSQPLQAMLKDVGLLLDETPHKSHVRESVEAIAQGVGEFRAVLDNKIRRVSASATAVYGSNGQIVDLDKPKAFDLPSEF